LSVLKEPQKVKFFLNIIYKDNNAFNIAEEMIKKYISEIDYFSDTFPFDKTDYYAQEMGKPLSRRFAVLTGLKNREDIIPVKISSISIESKTAESGKRRVNIDPGYLTLENVILTTGKNYTHRIYLGKGVFADLTLIFQKSSYRPLNWTYPDYASSEIITFFNSLRTKYLNEIRGKI